MGQRLIFCSTYNLLRIRKHLTFFVNQKLYELIYKKTLNKALNEKIYHDFAGSIGVIDNAIGLIKTIECQEKATKLVQDSINRFMSYLQFHRYVYSLPSEGNKIAIAEINRLSTDFLKSKNHNIELGSVDKNYS